MKQIIEITILLFTNFMKNNNRNTSFISMKLLFMVLLVPLFANSQTDNDSWDNRIIDTYANDIETARVSITFLPGFTTEGHDDFLAYIDPDIPFNGGVPVTNGEFNLNYIRVYTPIHDHKTTSIPDHDGLDYDQWAENITYFDGLGRQIQSIGVNASSVNSDIVQPVVYDGVGRQKQSYLPYAITQGGDDGPGGYRPDVVNEQLDFYDYLYPEEEGISFAEKEFDNSPLNRVLKQSAPGKTWKTGGTHELEYQYECNTASEVFLFSVTTDNKLNKEGCYPANRLFKTTLTDENNNETVEYKDLLDRLVMKKSECDGAWLSTYYVYDDLGLLRYVLPSLTVSYLPSGTTPQAFNNNTDWILKLCYYYEYDEENRLITKRIPGADAVLMVYNNRDQLVLSQDGNLENNDDWMFTKYDVFNRPIMTGLYHHTSKLDQSQMSALVENNTNYFESINLALEHGYSNDAFPVISSINCEIYTVSYYDNHDYIELPLFDGRYGFRESELGFMYPVATNNKGQLTATKTKILPNTEMVLESGLEFLIYAYYYDKYNHPIQTINDNHMGGLDVFSSVINFTGDVLLTKERPNVETESTSIQTQFSYDNGKRLIETKHKVNEENWVTLNQQKYDELGRVKRKHIHGGSNSALQTIDYKYNIRNWLTDINNHDALGSDLFAINLGYTNGTFPQYNGNIAFMEWKTSGFGNNNYNFDYDEANRLVTAEYEGLGAYNAEYTYDENGNMESLTRDGRLGETSGYGQIDELSYAYAGGNQLQSVNDLDEPNTQDNGFSDNASFNSTEYTYDDNGNLISDLNKNMTVSEYNYLNLPQQINIGSGIGHAINFLYTATGQKLRKKTDDNEAIDYIASFVYEDGVAVYILTPEGRIMIDNNSYEYHYFLKDHLGNTRITLTQNGEIIQEDAYYPFGMQMSGLSQQNGTDMPNKYLYNGKELQDDFDLDWYDYGARFYDPQLGRFHTIDKLSERYYAWSPFNYVGNNPIKRVDPFGNDWWDVVNGSVRGVTDNLTGLNTRSSYNPTSASDYNGALDQADKTSLVFGAGAAVGGGYVAGGGVVAAPETLGASLVVSVVAVGVAAEGTYMAANAAKNLQKGNNYGEDNKETGTKENSKQTGQKSGDKAQEQLEGIEGAQESAKKTNKGEKQNKIQSTKKSQQNLQNELNNLKGKSINEIDEF
jgi:RHS repeat-associated protein